MERACRALLFAMLMAGLTAGCQNYATAPDTGVEADGEPTNGDDWDEPDDGDPGWRPEGDPYIPPDGDGPVDDGGDQPQPDCPDISGQVWLAVDCGAESVESSVVIQDVCQVELRAGGLGCVGIVEPDGSVYLGCGDLGLSCRGKVHVPGMPFGLECDPSCGAGVFPVQGECYEHGMCPTGERCLLFVGGPNGLSLSTDCSEVNGPGPAVDNGGARCADASDCYSTWCMEEGFCADLCMPGGADCPLVQLDRPCADNADCRGQAICNEGWCSVPSTCQTRVLWMGLNPPDNEVFDWVNLCLPEARTCSRDGDCPDSAVCRLQTDLTSWDGFEARCGAPGSGDGDLGAPCDECRTKVCLAEGEPGICSRLCVTDADCQSPWVSGYCEDAQVWLLPGWRVPVRACVLR